MERGRRVDRIRFDDLIVDLDEVMEAYNKVPEAVRAELAKLGVEPKKKPKMPEPELDQVLSRMTNDDIGDFQGRCSVWEAYYAEKMGEYKTIAVAYKNRDDRILKRITEQLREQGVPATRAKEQAKEDNRYCKYVAETLIPLRTAAELEERIGGLRKQREACSRYVEFRVKEMEAHTRTENIQNRRRRDPVFRR